MIYQLIYIIFLLLFLCLIYPLFYYKKIIDTIKLSCSINPDNSIIKGDGFFIINNILTEKCRQSLQDLFLEECKKNKNLNEERELSIYTDSNFLLELSNIIKEKLYPVNSLDLQRCWLRYYFEGMKARYYENYHYDISRYNSNIKQYRLIIHIYDTSDAIFSIYNYGKITTLENMGILIEANKCYHKINITKGERLVLIMDFTTKNCDSLYNHYKCRGISSYSNWILDSIWRKVSSFFYKIANL